MKIQTKNDFTKKIPKKQAHPTNHQHKDETINDESSDSVVEYQMADPIEPRSILP